MKTPACKTPFSFYFHQRQHRTIPALRLKHRSGSCRTSLAVSALRIMRYCPKPFRPLAGSAPSISGFPGVDFGIQVAQRIAQVADGVDQPLFHSLAPDNQKSTKYEHVIPQLVDIEEDPAIEGLLVILNTVGGDVEAGLALAELISGVSKPSATLVLGGGHSIGIPLAVSARKSFIVPTATMTVHPVRHSGMVLGVPQTLRYFEQMQERIVSFVAGHSGISAKRFTQLMHNTGELVMDMGTVLGGEQAVEEGLIDAIGNLGDALRYLYAEIDAGKTGY